MEAPGLDRDVKTRCGGHERGQARLQLSHRSRVVLCRPLIMRKGSALSILTPRALSSLFLPIFSFFLVRDPRQLLGRVGERPRPAFAVGGVGTVPTFMEACVRVERLEEADGFFGRGGGRPTIPAESFPSHGEWRLRVPPTF